MASSAAAAAASAAARRRGRERRKKNGASGGGDLPKHEAEKMYKALKRKSQLQLLQLLPTHAAISSSHVSVNLCAGTTDTTTGAVKHDAEAREARSRLRQSNLMQAHQNVWRRKLCERVPPH